MTSMEDKILGTDTQEKRTEAKTANYFDDKTLWTVSKDGCGTCVMNGRMVHEMLDFASKKAILQGKKEVKYGDIKFKLKK